MTDAGVVKRARMACRVYLKLYDAGPAGAPITKDDVLGPGDDPEADLDAAMAVIGRFIDDTILDEPGHRDGIPHYALTAAMRDRMAEPVGARQPLADRLRADIRRVDRGEAVPDGTWTEAEALVRTGQFGGGAL